VAKERRNKKRGPKVALASLGSALEFLSCFWMALEQAAQVSG